MSGRQNKRAGRHGRARIRRMAAVTNADVTVRCLEKPTSINSRSRDIHARHRIPSPSAPELHPRHTCQPPLTRTTLTIETLAVQPLPERNHQSTQRGTPPAEVLATLEDFDIHLLDETTTTADTVLQT